MGLRIYRLNMTNNDRTLAGRVSQSVVDDVEEIAEEESASKSTVVRRFVEEGIERHKAEEQAKQRAGRPTSPLALVGVVSLATAPTLLATGHTEIGAVVGAVAAAYVLLWVTATDQIVEDALGDARDELREAGGVRAFFREVMSDHPVEDPDTLVERAARLDLVAQGLLVGFLAVALPAATLAWAGVLDGVLAALGPSGVRAYILVLLVLGYGFVLLMSVSALATLAIASARGRRDVVADSEPSS